ncbi:hypothetical protein HK098_003064 [Nowakowskiella sp. JEL0407]|nr:hypothetical protein HK098_003064 [Nowakowskiella sp. JEL0407]
MQVFVVPVLRDNYSYLVSRQGTNSALAIDQVNSEKIIGVLEEHNLKLDYILATHHHWDHIEAIPSLFKKFPNVKIYGSDTRIPNVTNTIPPFAVAPSNPTDLTQYPLITLPPLKFRAIHTPCHTTGSISYYFEDEGALFTGDTLFVAGCGRFFEGNAADMYRNMQVFKNLPKETKVYCGHEYTKSNLQFATSVEPLNDRIREKLAWAETQTCTIPSTIEDEIETNPFMRTDSPELLKKFKTEDPAELMSILRELKNKS